MLTYFVVDRETVSALHLPAVLPNEVFRLRGTVLLPLPGPRQA